MPTNANAYNSRVTDESLEKRFRDTFRSQGGAELVDDLYASGVIVPVVDFTAAATGTNLSQNLQEAWDFSTGHAALNDQLSTLITNAGFWKLAVNCAFDANAGANATISLSDGLTSKTIWQIQGSGIAGTDVENTAQDNFIVYVRSNDILQANAGGAKVFLDISYRQIATVNGDPVLPRGFTSS